MRLAGHTAHIAVRESD